MSARSSGTPFPFLTLGVGGQGHYPPGSVCVCTCVRPFSGGTAAHDLRTAGRYLAAPQGASSEGVEGLGFCLWV